MYLIIVYMTNFVVGYNHKYGSTISFVLEDQICKPMGEVCATLPVLFLVDFATVFSNIVLFTKFLVHCVGECKIPSVPYMHVLYEHSV